MRSRLVVVAVCCWAAVVVPRSVPAADAPGRPTASDPKAEAVADEVLAALGGADAWNHTRYIRFDFAVQKGGKTVASRAHTWDKWTGRYRLEGKDKQGVPFVDLMNVVTREGTAYKNGQKLDGAQAKAALDEAYGTWVNDTYWLIMPYKMKDPGVHLAYAGKKTEGKETYDQVHLTFGEVGLTPKDQYWVWVNTSTHLVDRWDFVLKGEKTPPSTFSWKGWARKGKILLAADHVDRGGTRIFFPVLDVPDTVPDSAFNEASIE